MTLEQILKEWKDDGVLDQIHIDNAALYCERLHSKYLTEIVNANMMLAKKKTEYNKLILEKYIYYTEGPKTKPSMEDIKRLPKGTVLKSEAEKYILADDDIISITLELALCQEKVDALKSIIVAINKRSYNIQSIVNFRKWQAGC